MAIKIGTPEWWKRETLCYGQQFINELDEPDKWSAHVMANGDKFLHIYNESECTTYLTLSAPTYRDLFAAAQFAWYVHTMMERGF